MSKIIIGSARIGESGKTTGGKAGDQTGNEVSTQDFYNHSKGWYIMRLKKPTLANALANKMIAACENNNIGYDQSNRLGITKYGISTKTKTECDCSSLVRECVKEATGYDPGNFTTSNECSALAKTGLFMTRKSYGKGVTLYTGDILVTKTKGHTAIVTSGVSRTALKSVNTIAKEVIAGKWGNGSVRKQKLEAAGYNYQTIQAEVNKLMKK